MKQNINIEYTEEEFKSVWGFFSHFVDAGASIIHKAMELESQRKVQEKKNEKIDKLKAKLQDQKNEINEKISDQNEDISDTKRILRRMEKNIEALTLQIEQLEENQFSDMNDSHINTRI
tara:strand:- start:521 stop:877 length:357 start_codon:yes stop_codon:yes gene_type:complete